MPDASMIWLFASPAFPGIYVATLLQGQIHAVAGMRIEVLHGSNQITRTVGSRHL